MTTYLIANFDVEDEARYEEYGRGALPIVLRHKGAMVVADRAARAVEGPTRGMVLIIAFPSQEDADGFYDDPAYQPLKAIRHAATTHHSMFFSPGL